MNVINPEEEVTVKPTPLIVKKKKGFLDKRLKRLQTIAVSNSKNGNNIKTKIESSQNKSDTSDSSVSSDSSVTSDGTSDGSVTSDGVSPRVILARTENFVHEPFERNQEVKVIINYI